MLPRRATIDGETLICSFDIGKNVHWLGCYNGLLEALVEPHKLRADMAGFAQATALIDPLLSGGRFTRAIIGHEFTGVYHEPWGWQIQHYYARHMAPGAACPVEYRLLNPLLTKRRRDETSIRPRSNDRTSVEAVAACLADGLGHPADLRDDASLLLRELVRGLEQLCARQRHLARQILPQVDRLWPGTIMNVRRFREAHPDLEAPIPIVETRPLERDRLGALLLHCPNPHDALALGREGLEDILRKHTGRGGPTAVETILQMLSQAPLPPRSVAGIYAQRLQADDQAYASLTERIAATESDIAAVVEQPMPAS